MTGEVGSLPQGLRLGTQLVSGAFGKVFELFDERLGFDSPVRKVARILPGVDSSDGWRKPLRERLAILLGEEFSHVAVPREAGTTANGSMYLLEDYLGESAFSTLLIHQGLDAGRIESILEQLLMALAALHACGIAHGDVRAKNVFFAQVSGTDKVTLADTVIGGLAFWSGGELCDQDARNYFPPEWKDKTCVPSFQADLFALGLVVRELCLGLQGNPSRDGDSNARAAAVAKLPGSTASSVRCILPMLLAPATKRPKDAGAALVKFRHVQARETLRGWHVTGIAALSLLLLICVVFGVSAWRGKLALAASNQQNGKLASEMAVKQPQLADQTKETLDLKDVNLRLSEECRRARDELEKCRGQLPSQVEIWARAFWEANCRGATDRAILSLLSKAIAELKEGKLHKDWSDNGRTEAVKLLEKWWKTANVRRARAGPWFANPTREQESKRMYDNILRQPWDEGAGKTFDDHLRVLEDASNVWNNMANDKLLTAESMGHQINGQREAVKKILQQWLGELNKGDYTLRLLRGTGPKDAGVDRKIEIVVTSATALKDWHKWAKSAEHAYSANDTIEFNRPYPGPLRLTLQGDRSFYVYRPYVIDQSFDGPLALWKAHKEGHVQEGDYDLEFEVLDCPGPPRELFNPSINPLKELRNVKP